MRASSIVWVLTWRREIQRAWEICLTAQHLLSVQQKFAPRRRRCSNFSMFSPAGRVFVHSERYLLSCGGYMHAGPTTTLGAAAVRKARLRRSFGRVLLALLLLQVQASWSLLPTSPARTANRPNRLPQHHRLPPPLSKRQPGSFVPALQQQQQLAAANRGHHRVAPLSSVQRTTTAATVGIRMGASSSRSGDSSPQQTSTLIGDDRSGGGGYGAAASETRLGAAASGETDPEDPGTGESASRVHGV